MDRKLQLFAHTRACEVCEYCRLHQRFSRLTFPVDHVIARQHRGETIESNVALACTFCNSHKGPNISGVDPVTGLMTRLFNPRRDIWSEHFRWNGTVIVGTSDVGRTTVEVLAMNDPVQIAIRSTLTEENVVPGA